ncbi:MAG: hypothetical protein HKN79_07345 [Flavobacteriales bacterium]|nr:hypothetical protein [Flavobacteriales bacterium]
MVYTQSSHIIVRSISLFGMLIMALVATAQITNISPYSRFGIGDPLNGDLISQFGMGSTGVAAVDGHHVNAYNPAGQSFLFTPVFEVGVMSQRLQVESAEEESTNSMTRLDHFNIGFPMWKGKWGAAFGLRPYSTIGYNNTVSQYSESLDTTYTAEYIGSGGVNRIYLDIARKLTLKDDTSKYNQDDLISLGIGGSYLFGSASTERNTVFPINSGFMSIRIEDATTLTDLTWNTGFILRSFLDRKEDEDDRKSSAFTLGASYSMDAEMNSKKSRNAYTYAVNVSGVEFPRDSITSFSDRRGTITLPGHLRFGASFEHYVLNKDRNRQRKLILAIDYRMSDWTVLQEDFGTTVDYSEMGESTHLGIGFAYSPQVGIQKGTRGNLLRLSTYRLGYRQGDSHLTLDNEVISESGISFGMSVPLLVKGRKETDTQFDFGIAYEERGTTESGLLKEQGVRIMFGFSFHPDYRFDRWFSKRRYD